MAENTPYNRSLTQSEMEENALIIAQMLRASGWTLEAIAGALGNFQSECTLNPNDPERATGFPTSSESRTHGFGLPQWTPWYNRYGAWCNNNGIGISATDANPAGKIAPQLAYLEYECVYGYNGGKTWYSNHGYTYTWTEYKTSNDPPETLATAFYWQYERSAAADPGNRPAQARAWYTFLGDHALADIPIWLLFKLSQRGIKR